MKQELKMLIDFHEKFQLSINKEPIKSLWNLHVNDINLRDNLILEEAKEFHEADKLDLKLDALCDLLYVAFGAAVTYGFTEILPLAFAEVHRSNMSKLWTEDEWSAVDLDFRNEHTYLDVQIKTELKCFLVKRKSDGKVVKSPSYSPADFKQFLTTK